MKPDEQSIGEIPLHEIVEVPMYGKKNVILDSQILTTLMACPRLADFRFNHNLLSIGGKSNSLECGSIVHKFLETYYGSIIKGVSKTQSEGFAFTSAELYIMGCPLCTDFKPTICPIHQAKKYTEACENCKLKPECGHKANEYPGVRNTPKESEGYKTGWHYVLDTCQQYLDYYRNDHWVPLEVEVVKGKVLYEDDEVRVLWKAKLDLVSDTNQGIYPVDHKTMKQRRDTISMNNQFVGQCLLMETRRVFINKVGFQSTLKPEEKFLRPPITYSAPRLIEWQSETLPYYSKLLLMYAESGHFPPNLTHCEGKYGNCAFLDVCESDPAMREDEIKRLFYVGPIWDITNDED